MVYQTANLRGAFEGSRFMMFFPARDRSDQAHSKGGLIMRLGRNSTKKVFTYLSVSLICLQLVIMPAFGQEVRGSISGRVVDGTNAAVVGAKVSVTNLSMNTSTAVKTDEGGNY